MKQLTQGFTTGHLYTTGKFPIISHQLSTMLISLPDIRRFWTREDSQEFVSRQAYVYLCILEYLKSSPIVKVLSGVFLVFLCLFFCFYLPFYFLVVLANEFLTLPKNWHYSTKRATQLPSNAGFNFTTQAIKGSLNNMSV